MKTIEEKIDFLERCDRVHSWVKIYTDAFHEGLITQSTYNTIVIETYAKLKDTSKE